MANVPRKFKSGVDISGSAEVDGDPVLTEAASQTVSNKTIDSSNTIDAGALPSNIDAAKIADGSVSNTEFQHLDGVTSDIQGQLDNKANSADLASNANGEGASLVGIEDAATQFTSTNVEGALTESLDAAQAAQADATQALSDASDAQTDIDNHIADAVGAHAATAVSYSNASSGLTAIEVQAAIDEVKTIADNSSAGLIQKDPARVASTADIDLSTGGLLTIDTVTVVAGDRVLVKNQTDPIENGVYDAAVGSWTRSSDFDGTPSNEVQGGNLVYVNEGSANIATSFRLQGNGELTVDTDSLTFLVYSRAEEIQAGDGLDKNGLTLSVDATNIAGAGLQEDGANNLELAPSSAGTGIQLNTGVYSLDFTEFDTDDLTEGSTNLFYTEGRFDTSFSGKDTDDLSEGAGSLYHTVERAQDAAGAMATNSTKVSLTYDDGANTLTPDIVAGSLVDADINASAAIDASKIADGSVSNTEFQHINSLTSNAQTQLDAKLNLSGGTMTGLLTLSGAPTVDLHASTKKYVDDSITASSGANTSLSNLTTTDINQSLIPTSTSVSIGSSGAGEHWSDAFLDRITMGQGTQKATIVMNNASGANRGSLLVDVVKPSGGSADIAMVAQGSNGNPAAILTNNQGGATASQDIVLETGNQTGTGDSGDISLQTGTSAGGARGEIVLDTTADSAKLANQPTGGDDLSISTTKYVDDAVSGISTGSAGDIDEATFAMANNQAAAANVTGLAFANATVRSFEALVSVEIDATADLYEVFTLRGVQKGAQWDMSVDSAGDISNVNFTITTAGQVQYTSGNEAGFSSGDIKFRAITTTV